MYPTGTMRSNSHLLVPSAQEKGGGNNFDLIRIAMALLVVWSHSYALYRGSEAREALSLLTRGTINSGNLGVFVFFMVSGYLITQSFDRSRSHWSYLKKRIARIYPGYMVATSICAFILVPIYSARAHYTLLLVLKTLGMNLLLQGYFIDGGPFLRNPQPYLDGSLWSIPFEFWCYLGVLALGVVGLMKQRWRGALLAIFVAVSLTRGWLEITGRKPGAGIIGVIIGWPYLWFKVLPCFLVGMLVYQYRDVLRRWLWLAVAAPLAVVVAANLPLPLPWKEAVVGVLFPPAVGYALFYFAFRRQIADIGRYGDFSYGTYLYAYPVQQMLLAAFGESIPFWLFIPLAMVLSLGAGVLSWFGVERWFNLSARGRKHAAPAVRIEKPETGPEPVEAAEVAVPGS
jgi:peptidoglycan/LPS O-acetylase OafA/YrhL